MISLIVMVDSEVNELVTACQRLRYIYQCSSWTVFHDFESLDVLFVRLLWDNFCDTLNQMQRSQKAHLR